MAISRDLQKRSKGKCELCGSDEGIDTLVVSPKIGDKLEDTIASCKVCSGQLHGDTELDPNHWRCLNDSMWSEIPAVQVVAYRTLHTLTNTDWAQDLIDMMYLDEETKEWAKSGITDESEKIVHKDANGVVLQGGDTVVLIKDLNVKGSSLTAKRGVAVRRIRLDPDNAEYIEGKVDGQHIVILTKFVKKSSS